MADFISKVTLPNNNNYPIRASAIPYGEVDSTSTATDFTATVPGIYALEDGVCILLRNNIITSASGFTININNLGAKPVYSNMDTDDAPSRETTIFNKAYTMLFIYSSDLVEDGAWICYRGFNSNDNTIGYQLRTNSSTMVAADKGYRYRLWFTSANGKKWVPANTSTSTNATTARTLNTRPIDPFGDIIYRSTNGSVDANADLGTGTIWQQYTLNIGYSYVKTLTVNQPVYLKCSPQTDGSAIMEDLVQNLPSSKDNKIYIFLGIAYSTTQMELKINHPVYYHDGTGIRLWTGKEVSDSSSPLGAYQATIGDGTSTTYTINHNLNNDFILVSVSITENNVTYMAPLASVASPNQIGYSLTITDSNNIAITFTSAPGEDAAKVSIVSTQAVAEAIDNLLLLTPNGEDYLKI